MVNIEAPAFPIPAELCQDLTIHEQRGMTLRDYFAANAMQAQIGNPLKLGDDEGHSLIAERAYRMADAMLKQRDKS